MGAGRESSMHRKFSTRMFAATAAVAAIASVPFALTTATASAEGHDWDAVAQ